MLDLETGKIKDFIKFDVGNLVSLARGAKCGGQAVVMGVGPLGLRGGTITLRSCPKPPDAAHVKVLPLPLTTSPLHFASLFPQAIATGGHNNGRVGTIVHKEKHKGSFDIVHIKDAGAHAAGGC